MLGKTKIQVLREIGAWNADSDLKPAKLLVAHPLGDWVEKGNILGSSPSWGQEPPGVLVAEEVAGQTLTLTHVWTLPLMHLRQAPAIP